MNDWNLLVAAFFTIYGGISFGFDVGRLLALLTTGAL